MHIVMDKDLCPKLGLTTLHEIASLLFEHRVLIRNGNELIITEALCVGNVRQIGISGLTEFTNDERFVQLHQSLSGMIT